MKVRPGHCLALLILSFFLFSCAGNRVVTGPAPVSTVSPQLAAAREKIRHVVIIMQENRSFEHYFGTYPGADGIPMKNGSPTVCSPDPVTGQCIKPFHDPRDINYGGPHGMTAAITDIDGGKMDGFVTSVVKGRRDNCAKPGRPGCTSGDQGPDAMGWHDAREIPNYWAYAQNFVLQDRMFEPSASWSLPAHLFLVSGWSARCKDPDDPMTCTNDIKDPPQAAQGSTRVDYAWTDMTYLLYKYDVS